MSSSVPQNSSKETDLTTLGTLIETIKLSNPDWGIQKIFTYITKNNKNEFRDFDANVSKGSALKLFRKLPPPIPPVIPPVQPPEPPAAINTSTSGTLLVGC